MPQKVQLSALQIRLLRLWRHDRHGDQPLCSSSHIASARESTSVLVVQTEQILGISLKTEVTTDSGMPYDVTFTNTPAIKETGSESYGGETRTFTYFFNKATGELLSGTEVS